MKEMHNRIRDLREDMDLRQIDLAHATGIDQKTISNYETGKTNPDSDAIITLAKFFNVTTDYLLGYSNIDVNASCEIEKILLKIEKNALEIKKFLHKGKNKL